MPRRFRSAGSVPSPIPASAPARCGTSSPSTRPASSSATHIGVVGDQRIRIDLGALRILGDGLAWAPGAFFNQDGTPDPYCSRGTLRRVEERLSDAGIDAVVGHEIEFLLVEPDGGRLPSHTVGAVRSGRGARIRGLRPRRDRTRRPRSGVAIEQFHPEYGVNQFEISLSPQSPGGGSRPTGADAHHHRPGRPPIRAASQPVPGAVRRQRRIRCAPALLAETRRRLRCSRTEPGSAA